MRINFDWQKQQNTEQTKTSYTGRGPNLRSGEAGSHRFLNRQTVLDISGKVTDDFSYGDQGRFTEEVVQAVGIEDYMLLQRNFNAVMSNSMSGKDFLAMEEEGFDVYRMEPEEMVTILDEIKVNVAKSGKEIAGYNDDLSMAELEEVTGSSSHARKIAKALKQSDAPVTRENIAEVEKALSQALSLKELEEGNIAWLLKDGLEPTLSNLYKAGYSSVNLSHSTRNTGYATGSYGRQGENLHDLRKMKVTEEEYTKLNEQLAKRLEESGLKADEENLSRAGWLMEKGFPVDEKNLKLFGSLQELSLPPDADTIIRQAAQALAEGRNVGDIPVQGEVPNVYQQAANIYDRYQQLPMEAVDYAVSQSLSLTLQNMEGYYRIEGSFTVQIQARRTLEEVRLKMTVEANLKLLQSGFSIDTAPMEELISQLDSAQKEWEQSLFGKNTVSGKGELFLQTLDQVSKLPKMPLALIGKIPFMARPTLSEIGQEGRLLQKQYEAASESYEILMTAPRRDMGDSIQKAFRNVDDILNEMNLEITQENQRAVRILGYNRMEINEENLWRVQEADRAVQDVIKGMKPGLTLDMIRKGKNPLEMTLSELQEYISEQENDFANDTDKYSKFLYKLEQRGEIGADERKAYIGIYRLLRQIEKSDGAVIGSLVAQGAELNLPNLLSAVRSRKAGHTDIRVDDSTGFLQDLKIRGTSISSQIEEGFAEIRRNLSEGQTLEELVQEMEQITENSSADEELARMQLKEIRQILKDKENRAEYLTAYHQPITIDNLQSAGVLAGQRGSTFKKIRTLEENFLKEQEAQTKETKQISFLDKAVQFISHMDEPQERETSYQDIIEEAGQVLENAITNLGNEAGYVDIRGIRQLYKQLHLASDLAREENYEIPVQIGEEITSINLKIIHSSDSAGEVKITMDTEELGKVEARFRMTIDTLEGSILTEYMDKKEVLASHADALNEAIKEALEEAKIEMKQILFGTNEMLNINTPEASGKAEHTDTALLYKVAKGFITFIKTL